MTRRDRPAAGEEVREDAPQTVVRGFRSTVGREATTFGFSILVTVVFGVVQRAEGPPDGAQLVLYASGAVLSFTLLEAVLSRGFTRAMAQHHTEVVALGTAFNVISVLGALASAFGLAAALPPNVAWAVCPFVAGVVYLSLESLETALAEAVFQRRGDERASDTEG